MNCLIHSRGHFVWSKKNPPKSIKAVSYCETRWRVNGLLEFPALSGHSVTLHSLFLYLPKLSRSPRSSLTKYILRISSSSDWEMKGILSSQDPPAKKSSSCQATRSSLNYAFYWEHNFITYIFSL